MGEAWSPMPELHPEASEWMVRGFLKSVLTRSCILVKLESRK